MEEPDEFVLRTIYGGVSIKEQKEWLKEGIDIVISTSDRLLELI